MQSQCTLSGLFLTYTLIPAVLNLISLVPMLFYKLSGKKMAEIQARLAERRLAEGEILDDDGNVVKAVEEGMAMAAEGAGVGEIPDAVAQSVADNIQQETFAPADDIFENREDKE